MTVISELQKFGFMLGDPLSEEGLNRKLDLLSARLLRRLINRDYDLSFIENVLAELEKAELYPLRKAKYSWRYKALRYLTRTPGNLLKCKEYKNLIVLKRILQQ